MNGTSFKALTYCSDALSTSSRPISTRVSIPSSFASQACAFITLVVVSYDFDMLVAIVAAMEQTMAPKHSNCQIGRVSPKVAVNQAVRDLPPNAGAAVSAAGNRAADDRGIGKSDTPRFHRL